MVLAGSFEIRPHRPIAPAFLVERLDLLGQVFRARAAIRSAFLDISMLRWLSISKRLDRTRFK